MTCSIAVTAGWWAKESRHCLHHEYVQAISHAGGLPVIIPFLSPQAAVEVYEAFDGFVLSGGADLDPAFFGEEPRYGIGAINPERDYFELSLAKLALQGTKPLLAICRGLQVLNVAAGGTLHQNLQGITLQQHNQDAPRWHPYHQIELDPHSGLAGILGCQSLRVNTFHHQAIKEVGTGLKAVGWSKDGLVEAVETCSRGQAIWGVQWHPECSWDRDKFSFRLFQRLIEAAGGLTNGANSSD